MSENKELTREELEKMIRESIAKEFAKNDDIIDFVQTETLDSLKDRYSSLDEDESIRNESYNLIKKSNALHKERPAISDYPTTKIDSQPDDIKDAATSITSKFSSAESVYDNDQVSFSSIDIDAPTKAESAFENFMDKRRNEGEFKPLVKVKPTRKYRSMQRKAEKQAKKLEKIRANEKFDYDFEEEELPKRNNDVESAFENVAVPVEIKPDETETVKITEQETTPVEENSSVQEDIDLKSGVEEVAPVPNEPQKTKRKRQVKKDVAVEEKTEEQQTTTVAEPEQTEPEVQPVQTVKTESETNPLTGKPMPEIIYVTSRSQGHDLSTKVVYYDDSMDNGVKENTSSEVSEVFSETNKKHRWFRRKNK